MTRFLSITLSLCALAITAGVLFLCWRISLAVDTAHIALWNVSTAAYNVNPTISNVNAATGVWAQASQKQADAADALIRDLRVLSWHTDRSFLKLDTMLDNYATIPEHLNKTTDAATGLTQEATKTLQTVNDPKTGIGPLLADSDASMKHLDELIRSKDISDTIHHVNGIAEHVDGTTGDMQAVSDDLKKRYFTPAPWWKKIASGVEFTIKAGNKALGWW